MSTLRVNTLQNTSGVEVYTCKAWVNFNGTGTVAIRASGNVSSITDNGVGDYTVNFTTAMPDANYMAAVEQRTNAMAAGVADQASKTATTITINYYTNSTGGVPVDRDCAGVAIFR
jgi:hypothetical protein